jgi:sterol O-acyltransferase
MASISLPNLDPSSSLEEVPRLVGKLDANGIASLEADETIANGQSPRRPPRSLKVALDAVAPANGKSGETTPDSEEDYDKMQHDPLTVVVGGKGGGFDGARGGEASHTGLKQGLDAGQSKSRRSQSTPPHLTSIPVTLKKADQKGQYYLIADDAELKEILKMGFERVCLSNNTLFPCQADGCWRTVQCFPRGGRSSVT